MTQAFSWLARVRKGGVALGLDSNTPEDGYWMIDKNHLTSMWDAHASDSWTCANPMYRGLRNDLTFWGFNLDRLPRVVLLNIEDIYDWETCQPAMLAIVNQLREIRDDVTIALYAHNDAGHAAGIVDAKVWSANLAAHPELSDEAILARCPIGCVPMIHPGDHDDATTARAAVRLRRLGHETLLLWEVCSFVDHSLRRAVHSDMIDLWNFSKGTP